MSLDRIYSKPHKIIIGNKVGNDLITETV
jgi:hypothetical protein